MKKYALIGEKLSHSHSPLLHGEIFKDLNVLATYEKLEIGIDELEETINLLRKGIYSGFNVTIPYKKEVIKYLDELSDEAKIIGAVNTIAYKNGKLIGYNTDYYGFKEEVIFNNIDVKEKECYILGTGGASLALNQALIDLGAKCFYVSRNKKNDNIISYDELKNKKPYLLVNSTPVGMYPNVDDCPVDKDIINNSKYVIDIIFNPKQTKLLEYANSNMNGLFMLVGQAIKAEEIWQNKKYDKDIVTLLKRIEMMIWTTLEDYFK